MKLSVAHREQVFAEFPRRLWMYPCGAISLALGHGPSYQPVWTPQVQKLYGEPEHVCSIFVVLPFNCFGPPVPPKPSSSHAGRVEIRPGGVTGANFALCESKLYLMAL